MTNRLALYLFVLLALGITALAVFDRAAGLFLLRKFSVFIEWVIFWR